MKQATFWFSILLVSLSTGCASGVTRPLSGAETRPQLSSSNQVASVTVTLTEEAKALVANNLKFNPEELLGHVKRALDAHSLINASPETTRPTLEVRVKDFRVRTNFTAVMFGFMAGTDSITADIVLKSPEGKELDKFEVSVHYALGGFAGGQDSTRMGWLYEKFAEETVKEIKKPWGN